MSTINTMPAFNFTKAVMASTLSATKKTVGLTKTLVKKVPVAVKQSWNALPESTKTGAMFIGAELVSVIAANTCKYAAGKTTDSKLKKTYVNGQKYYSAVALGCYFVGEAILAYSSYKELKGSLEEKSAAKPADYDRINADIARMSEEIKDKAIHPNFESDIQPDYKLDEADESSVDHDQF